jgi:hypothetical protein
MMAMTRPLGPDIGSQLLSELGFLHVPGPPLSATRAYLFVALRRPPTLRHFDPERVDYWATAEGVGRHEMVGLDSPPPARPGFAWGHIHIVDRLGVGNDYVSFGGELHIDRVDRVMVAVFSSDAPILARGGHSQGWDPLAEEASGFVARLRAGVGRSRERELAANALSPAALYAAFVVDALAREEAAAKLVTWHPLSQSLLRREGRRLAAQRPLDWAAGEALAGMVAVASRP